MAFQKTLPSINHPSLQSVLGQILQVIKPQRIVLFGSAARGEMKTDSDLDILVIVRGPVHRRQIEQKIYANLRGIKQPVDVIVATEEDIENYQDHLGMIYRPAIREGRVVYEI